MATNGTSHEPDLDQLKRSLGTLQADVAQLMQTLLGEKEHALTEAARSGKRALESTEAGIRQRPFIALLLAFVVGLLFGRVATKVAK